ncbi:PepSY-like domain-containing protein [Flavobacterium phragmitis]|uniref:Putative beta-lactamase-inhibitor-like, PepSY-like n=1 Tax=Flavobacterium phragmitis TaxID=739143 RepID=A0A1I1QGZ8_9FLAO|nr:PepSY-like domain-containing protein [Flavobacterium phragmitis]SFD21349.1 Putative beta-lactamase-inhibitor-like, PepSY-like [Flavobacterium phragmitis]
MKNVFLIFTFLCSSFLIAQEGTNMKKVITPPEQVRLAFEKEYPGKVPVWAEEYVGDDNDEVRYEARYNVDSKTKALAIYDNLGNMKAYELQIPLSQLPAKAQAYLKKNYPAKAIREIAVVVDYNKITTYEVGITKEDKFYDIQFDKDGGFNVIIEKN